MANKCTWWHVYSALVYLMKYQISKVCLALIYKKYKHMVYGELHILPYLVLDKDANYNAYSNLIRHEVWNVDQRIIILRIDLCYNIFSHIWVQHQHYPEHDTFFPSVFFPWIVPPPPWSIAPFWRCSSSRWYLNYWAKLTSLSSVPLCILICE